MSETTGDTNVRACSGGECVWDPEGLWDWDVTGRIGVRACNDAPRVITLLPGDCCPDCHERLNADGTTTLMVPAQPSEAVRGTWLWTLLGQIAADNIDGTFMRDAADTLGLLNADGSASEQHAIILAALSAPSDAADLREAVALEFAGNCTGCPVPVSTCRGPAYDVAECRKLVGEWLNGLLDNYRKYHKYNDAQNGARVARARTRGLAGPRPGTAGSAALGGWTPWNWPSNAPAPWCARGVSELSEQITYEECIYDAAERQWWYAPHGLDRDGVGEAVVDYHPHDGTRLNADGTE